MTAYKKSLRAYKGKTGIVQVWGAEGNQPELATYHPDRALRSTENSSLSN